MVGEWFSSKLAVLVAGLHAARSRELGDVPTDTEEHALEAEFPGALADTGGVAAAAHGVQVPLIRSQLLVLVLLVFIVRLLLPFLRRTVDDAPNTCSPRAIGCRANTIASPARPVLRDC